MLGLDAPSHWVILVIAAVILFGYKKLPDITRSVGRSLRIFKTEMKGLTDDDAARTSADASQSDKAEPAATIPVIPVAPVSPQAPVVVPPSLGADTSPGVPAEPAAEAPRETPQQQTQS
jgi:sec-independent protein translocase protein TatA